MDNTLLIGEAKTLAQLISRDFSETNNVFEDSVSKSTRYKLGRLNNLRSVILPSATLIASSLFSENYRMDFVDLGPVNSAIGQSAFNKCYLLRDFVLRRANGVTPLQNANVFLDTPAKNKPQIVNVYVPRELISSYQVANIWSTSYASNSDLFKAIEDYTVDGTLTGEMDWALIDALPTPLYTLEEQTFNGSSDYVDTNIQLFDTVNPEFTIVCDFEWPAQSGSNAGIFGCSTSSEVGIRARRNSTATNIAFEHKRPGVSSTHYNTTTLSAGDRIQVAWYVKDGLSTLIVYKDGADYQIYYNNGMTPSATLSKTLVIGMNDWGGNSYYKGTMHLFKVFGKALNARQIRTVLGID